MQQGMVLTQVKSGAAQTVVAAEDVSGKIKGRAFVERRRLRGGTA